MDRCGNLTFNGSAMPETPGERRAGRMAIDLRSDCARFSYFLENFVQ